MQSQSAKSEKSDIQLLREYARDKSDPSFAEIITRHTDFVFSAAIRQTGSSDLARDVAQNVFIDLARRADTVSRKLDERSSLAGWLYRSTRFESLNLRRGELRRFARERQAMEQLLPTSDTAPDWDSLHPILDEAMADLDDPDREALLLRYFKNHDLRAVGISLGVSEDAAQKRVTRAIERLRELVAKRGLAVAAGGLVTVISANAVQAAPVGLVTAITSAVSLTGVAIASSTAAIATKAIAMTTLQKTLVSAVIVAAVGVGIYETRDASNARTQVQTLQQQHTDLAAQIGKLQEERDQATNRLASMAEELSRAKGDNLELARLRGEVTRLKAAPPPQRDDPASDEMKSWLARTDKLKRYLADSPAARIPEMRLLDDNAFSSASRSMLNTERDYLAAMSNLRSLAEFQFITTLLNPALTEFAKANNGQFPADLSQLKPYFPAPVEDAIIDRWQIAPASSVRTDNFGDPIITTKAPVDADFDQRYAVGLNGFASAGKDTTGHNGWGVIPPERVLDAAAKAYRDANNGQNPTDISQVLPYLTTPEQQAAYQKFLRWRQSR